MSTESWTLSTQEFLHLENELRLAIGLLKTGLGELQAIDAVNDFYHFPMLLLASGYERLMKCVLCFKYKAERGRFPDAKYLSKLGHDLNKLRHRVIDECFTREYVASRQAAQQDVDYVRHDELLGKLLDSLSAFGKQGRYYNLDVVCGKIPPEGTDSPEQVWSQMEMDVMRDQLATLTEPGRDAEFWNELTRRLVVRFEQFARALARLFTLAEIHPDAKRLCGTVSHFLFLMDADFGNHDYRQENAPSA